MLVVSTVSYMFSVNGHHTRLKQVRREIHQGDPISPLLFVIVMEYLNRILYQMQKNHDYAYHAKCERLCITNLNFADDLILFTMGDSISVELMMMAFDSFSKSTGLVANLGKCKICFGSVHNDTKSKILDIISFIDGPFPFKYLGVQLTCKKLYIHHYMSLVVKIVSTIMHWSTDLLSYAGRVQLIKIVTFAIVNYWMKCFPMSENVIKMIEAICRSFLWTRGPNISRKSLVAWDTACKPK